MLVPSDLEFVCYAAGLKTRLALQLECRYSHAYISINLVNTLY